MPDGSLNSIGHTEVDLPQVETNENAGFFARMRERLTGLFGRNEAHLTIMQQANAKVDAKYEEQLTAKQRAELVAEYRTELVAEYRAKSIAESHARNMARRRRDSARENSLTGDILAADEYRT